ncbi:alkaline shock response membrane anchor protein AmaP [Loigolactobacillus coryniformis]|uniref:alkaline shock response membrane anchor protein AmaP n=1 Tax=Loigolactobacillus coryniformis TaxID=1610 RepID=UPI00234005EF|nr:alkaline shock response membrane anchor protein AmaP [Loigolactobacillus coryniformis]MDC4186976.1 alkaline shock response membrane anchor protein AmaP [Loigolactobacillus coryniformis]
MRPIFKFALGLLAFLGLLEAIWFGLLIEPMANWSGQLMQWQQEQIWLSWVGLGLAIIAGLIFLVLLFIALFKRSTTTSLNMKTKHGQLNISRTAVEKSVKYAVQEQHPVTEVDVAVQLLKHKALANAQVNATLTSTTNDLVGASQRIEKTAKHELTERLGVPVKNVDVHLLTVDQRKQPMTDVI